MQLQGVHIPLGCDDVLAQQYNPIELYNINTINNRYKPAFNHLEAIDIKH
jgi:hypothetical protein